MRPPKDITNQKFGKLLAIKRVGSTPNKRTSIWLFLCDCGNYCKSRIGNVLRGSTFTCGCSRKRKRPELYKKDTSFNSMYSNYKRKAELRNLSFELSKEQFESIAIQNCSYCGSIPKTNWGYARVERLFSGIDRINNKLGYSKDNCVPCCKTCNFGKRDMDKDVFINWATKVANYAVR